MTVAIESATTTMTGGFVGLFAEIAAARPDRVFARCNGAPITFGELDGMSARIAAGLRRTGVGRGDRVALMMSNGPLALAMLFGMARASAVWVPVNRQLRGEGLRHVLENSDPRLVIAEAESVPTIEACGASNRSIGTMVAGDPSAALRLDDLLGGEGGFDEPLPADNDCFAIMYTSGTTGPAKGVLVTHRMIRMAGEGARRVADVRDGDVLFLWEPLYHVGGAQVALLPLLCDVSLAMVDRFSASRFWSQAKEAGATHIHYLGGILQILLRQPESTLDRTHGVRVAWGGGCAPDAWRPFEERFGVAIRECYGMTEASSIATCNDRGIVGSVGRPMPWFDVEIRDSDDAALPSGGRGEIVMRTSIPGTIFQGYFRNQEATARALRAGALHSGDLGSLDAEGNLFFHGRMNDSVRCRGENVSAWEVEHVAASHPAVEDCAIIGVAGGLGEQEIKLFVQPKQGATFDFAAFSAWLGTRLAPYQNPRYFALVNDFERTPSQRIMKHRLSSSVDDCWDRGRGASEAAGR